MCWIASHPTRRPKEMKEMKKFTLRLTEEELEILSAKAAKKNKSKNEYLKTLMLQDALRVEGEVELHKELVESYKAYVFQLKKIGTVLNQCNKNFNTRVSVDIEGMEKELRELWQLINRLKAWENTHRV